MSDSGFVKRLREDPMYKAALGKARSAQERKVIASLVEGLVGGIGGVLGPVLERVERDPEFARQLNKALIEGKDVLTGMEPVTSGSIT